MVRSLTTLINAFANYPRTGIQESTEAPHIQSKGWCLFRWSWSSLRTHRNAERAASEQQSSFSRRKRPTEGEAALTFLQSQSRQLQGVSAGLDLGFPIRRCNGDAHAAIQVNVVVWATFPVPSLAGGCSPHSLTWILTRGSATMRKARRRHLWWSCTHTRQRSAVQPFRRKNKNLSLLLPSWGPRVFVHMERVLGEKLLLPQRRNQRENLPCLPNPADEWLSPRARRPCV